MGAITKVKRSAWPVKKGFLLWAFLIGGYLLPPIPCTAQENFEICVLPSETVPAGKTMIELQSNMALRGTTQKTEGVLPTQEALHESLEITHGLTSWFEVGLYTFSSIQPGLDWQWVGNSIRPRVRIPESWNWPVGLSFMAVINYEQPKFSTDTWTVEILPIIDKKLDRWYFSFNPALGLSLSGKNTNQGIEFNPRLKISYDLTSKIAGGIEYYGSLGPIRGFYPFQKQKQQIFPVIDLNLGPDWDFNFGVGFGLTGQTDRLVVKMILEHRF